MSKQLISRIYVILVLLSVLAIPAQALPEVKVGTGFAVTPTQALTYYQAQGMTSPAWTEDPEIKKLAAALGNDPDRIYQYVHDEIDVIPLFGVHAGARGAYIDKAGTPFDQAEFMVELLRSAGVTAKYQLGTITLTGSQFNDWFGITNATAARKLLADGGTPYAMSDDGTTVTSVTMMHVWVIATIGGSNFAFDPSFKSHTVTAGIDVGAAMGFNASTFFSNAIAGATTGTNSVQGFNRDGVRASLTNYATTLLTYLKTSQADASIEDIIGGRKIVPYAGASLRQALLPYQASTTSLFSGDLPDCLKTRVTLQVSSTLTFNWNLDDIYGRQIAVEMNENYAIGSTSPQYRLLLGGQDMTGWLVGDGSGIGNQIPFLGSVTLNHPYAAGTSASVVDGTYMDHSSGGIASALGGVSGAIGAIQISISSGRPSADLASWQERNHTGYQGFIRYYDATSSEPPPPYPQQVASRRRMATTLQVQLHELAKLVGGLANSEVLVHDVVEVSTAVGVYNNSNTNPNKNRPVGTSYMISSEPTISAIARNGDTSLPPKVTRTFAVMASALEGTISQQVADSAYPVSAVAQLDWANFGPAAGNRAYYYATSANWATVKPQILLDYHQNSGFPYSPMRDQAEVYINAGYTVLIPRSSSLGPAPDKLERVCDHAGAPVEWKDFVNPPQGYWTWVEKPIPGLQNLTDGGGGGPTGMPPIMVHVFVETSISTPVQTWFSQGSPASCSFIDDPNRAGAFIAINPVTGSIAHISSREFAMGKGGGGSTDVETNPSRVFSLSADFQDQQYSTRASAQNVDLKSGTLEYTPPPDLVVGNGGYPYSLSFQRSYRSGVEDGDTYLPYDYQPTVSAAQDSLFGIGGWTSNLHHYAHVGQDASQVFGRDDPRIAAQTLATVQALLSIEGDGASSLETLERQISGVFAASWWADTLVMNTITIHQGTATQVFTKLVDGTYTQRGSAVVAELLGQKTIVKHPLEQGQWVYQTCVRLIGSSREVTYFGIWDQGFSSCIGGNPVELATSSSDNGSDMGFSRQTFPFGVTVTWNESTRTLSNNLGRSLTLGFGTQGYGTGGTVTDNNGRTVSFVKNGLNLDVVDVMGQPWHYSDDGTAFEVRAPSNPTLALLRAEYTGFADALGVVDKIKDALGQTTTYNIGGGRAASVVDALGSVTRTYHDRFGNVRRVEDPLGRVVTTEYDNYRRKVKVTAPEGNFSTFTYDARSNVLTEVQNVKPGSTTIPASRTVSTKTYDALCNVALTDTDALNRTTTAAINQTTCQVNSVTAADGGVTAFAYSALGQMTQKTDPTGLVTQMSYDAQGNVTGVVVDPGASPHIAATTAFAYDAAGNITQLTDPRGFVHTASYDAMRRLTQYNAPTGTGAVTKWTYDMDGLVTKIERATGNGGTPWAVTQYAYLPTARVASTTDADGRVTRFTYDADNRLVFTIDPENRQTKKIYDAAGQVIEDRRGVGTANEQAYATFAYTANGKQEWIKDAKLNQTTYTYDGYDRLDKTTFPDVTYEQLAYDLVDNVKSKRTRGNQLITDTYDAMNRVVTHEVPQPNSAPAILTTTIYDLAGRPTSISDNTGQSLTYHFDTAKRIDTVTQAAPTFSGTRVVTYEYDNSHNRTRMTWPDGYNVKYAYDALNRMTTATEGGIFVLASYVYDPLSRRTSLVYGNGTSQGYSYSTQGDLLALATNITGTVNTTTNTVTRAHQIASEVATNAAWGYVPAAFQTTNYGAANNLNQYTNVTVGANPTAMIAYDASGNLISDGTWTFAYDAQNMLRSAVNASSTSSYLYDPLGRRQTLSENATTTTFLHDGDEEIADYSGAAVLRRYVPGPVTDTSIAMVSPSGGSNSHKYFHTNRQGSTIAMSDDNGTIAEGPYTYDAFGNGAPTTGVPFKFTGRRLDPGTGLYYYRARYYASNLGRFLQVDPVGYGDQMNTYSYVGNDPTNTTDPSGTVRCCTSDDSTGVRPEHNDDSPPGSPSVRSHKEECDAEGYCKVWQGTVSPCMGVCPQERAYQGPGTDVKIVTRADPGDWKPPTTSGTAEREKPAGRPGAGFRECPGCDKRSPMGPGRAVVPRLPSSVGTIRVVIEPGEWSTGREVKGAVAYGPWTTVNKFHFDHGPSWGARGTNQITVIIGPYDIDTGGPVHVEVWVR